MLPALAGTALGWATSAAAVEDQAVPAGREIYLLDLRMHRAGIDIDGIVTARGLAGFLLCRPGATRIRLRIVPEFVQTMRGTEVMSLPPMLKRQCCAASGSTDMRIIGIAVRAARLEGGDDS